jgi:hypothetical protein
MNRNADSLLERNVIKTEGAIENGPCRNTANIEKQDTKQKVNILLESTISYKKGKNNRWNEIVYALLSF